MFAPIRLALASSFLLPLAAAAQTPEVEQHTEEVTVEAPEENTISLASALGGTLNQGNTESWQLTTGADFLLVRSPHAFAANARFSYGQSNDPEDDQDVYVDTVRNLNARARYDYFLTDYDALFLAGVFRWDTFAGLDHRMQGQVGYLRMLIRKEKHRLWGEVGYDLTYDNFDPDPLLQENPNDAYDPNQDADADGIDDQGDPAFLAPTVLPGTQTVHSARLFVGYDNQINENLTYLGGLEALINVEDPEDTRINFDNAVRSAINSSMKLELKVSVQYDNVPVEGKKDTDVQSVISIIYTLI